MAKPFEVGSIVVRVWVLADNIQQQINKAVTAVQNIGKTGQQVNQALEQTAQRTRAVAQAAAQAVDNAAAVGPTRRGSTNTLQSWKS